MCPSAGSWRGDRTLSKSPAGSSFQSNHSRNGQTRLPHHFLWLNQQTSKTQYIVDRSRKTSGAVKKGYRAKHFTLASAPAYHLWSRTDSHPGEGGCSQCPCTCGAAQHWPEDLHVWPPLSRQHRGPKQVSPRTGDGWQLCHIFKDRWYINVVAHLRCGSLKRICV